MVLRPEDRPPRGTGSSTSRALCEAEVGKDAVPVHTVYCVPETCVPNPLIMDVNELEGSWHSDDDESRTFKHFYGKGFNNNFLFQCLFCNSVPYCFCIWCRQCGGCNYEGWSNTFSNGFGHNLTIVDDETMSCARARPPPTLHTAHARATCACARPTS